jgi:hypothetical protein
MLGSLLNDPIYEKVARTSMNSIFSRRNNETGLFGNELNIHTGEWIGMMSGLGAGLDSFYEYLLKVYNNILEQNTQINIKIRHYIIINNSLIFNRVISFSVRRSTTRCLKKLNDPLTCI